MPGNYQTLLAIAKALKYIKSTASGQTSKIAQLNNILKVFTADAEYMKTASETRQAYNDDKINAFSFGEIKQTIFASASGAKNLVSNSSNPSELMLATKGVFTDILGAAANFTFGIEIEPSAQI